MSTLDYICPRGCCSERAGSAQPDIIKIYLVEVTHT